MQQEVFRSFRIIGQENARAQVDSLLTAQGFTCEPLGFYSAARVQRAGPLALGSSLAARFGHIYIQDASSMLPALVLARLASEHYSNENSLKILDMCSSPGGKSTLIADLLGADSLVLANEPSPKRYNTLRHNITLQNIVNAGTSAYSGEQLPLPSAGSEFFSGWDCILLDPPCSGWGTAEKNPQVLKLWQGDKIKPLISLQRLLLYEALRLLKPGGVLVYSTCTMNVEENEAQVRWACSELADGNSFKVLPLLPFPGFNFEEPLMDCAGVLRVAQGSPLGQGFFIAALQKSLHAPVLASQVSGRRLKTRRKGESLAQPDYSISWADYLAGASKERVDGLFMDAMEVETGILDSPLCSTTLLPPGKLLASQGRLYFYHAGGLEFLPAAFSWSGFQLGKTSGSAALPRLDTALHCLMPTPKEAGACGGAVLNLEDIAPIEALLSGQSLRFETKQAEAGLYYQNLPLCRLKARGGRVFI